MPSFHSSFVFLAAIVAISAALSIRNDDDGDVSELFHYSKQILGGQTDVLFRPFRHTLSPNQVFDGMLKRKSRAFDFFPQYVGTAKTGQVLNWRAKCFNESLAELIVTGDDSVKILVITKDRQYLLCNDLYVIGNELNAYVHDFTLGSNHTLHFTGLTKDEMEDVRLNGFHFFDVEDHILGSVADAWDTLTLFLGPWSKEDSVKFLKDRMNINYPARTKGLIDIKEDDIPSGTYLSTQRFDGSEVMIQYGTGSMVGHSTIALRLNGSLHVCESTDKNTPDYWPPPYGVICHPWSEWIDLAMKAGYSVSLLPLSDERQAMFNDSKAQAFVESVLGLPYGYHNFLWGWYDTVGENFPPPFSSQMLLFAFSVFDRVKPALTQRIVIEAANQRLGTKCETFVCLMETIDARNSTLEAVMTMPEQDTWEYKDGKSMVCNVFVLETMKAAGVFEGLEIEATEFTPRDLYTLKIFNDVKLRGCPVDASPVCQIMGDWGMLLPEFNTVVPYSHMCERCPTMYPQYDRPAGC